MKNVAFIFARGGSKGLPRKNLMPLIGKSLLEYSIETAFDAPSIEKVFVSTDDQEIANVAKGAKAEVIDRPPHLASDDSPEWLSWRHAIEWVKSNYGEFEKFISLPTTSPLRQVCDVESAINRLDTSEADICISVTAASRSPYFNMVKKSTHDFVELVIKPENDITRRQDAPQVFDITTVVYVAKPNFILEKYGIFSGHVTSIEIPKQRAVDIDDIYDFKLAEAILKDSRSG